MERSEVLQMIRESRKVFPAGRSGRLTVGTDEEYRDFYRMSIDSSADYWASVARELVWMKPWEDTFQGSLPDFKFFVGGLSNVSVNCIDRHLRTQAQKIALIWIGEDGSERRWTYQTLYEETARFASVLKGMGVAQGDVVAIFMPNLLETFAAVHACYRIGAIYNVIFSGFSQEALNDRLRDTGAKVVITADEAVRRGKAIPLKKTLDGVLDSVPTVRHVVVVRRTGAPVNMKEGRDRYWHDWLASVSELAEPVPIEANEPGFIIYTSGTTSKPKGLVHAGIGFLVGAYHNVKYALDLGPEDVYWCTADVGWLTFPIFELVGALAHGTTALVYEGALDYPSPDQVYRIMAKHRVTKIFTAPTLLRMLARYGPGYIKSHDLSALSLIALVGEPLDASTWNWVRDHIGSGQVEINNTYGQSETGSAWTSSLVGTTSAKPGSCGVPLPGHAFKIVDDDGQEVEKGSVGHLMLSNPFPALARTIWHDHEKYLATYFPHGPFYATHDAAVLDDDGHVWVLGRIDDVINVSAHRLSTMEMESAVLELDHIAEAAVVGIGDAIKGEVPVVFVTFRQGYDADTHVVEEVTEGIVRSIGSIARPAHVFLLHAMPKTRSGKIVRRLLKEVLLTHTVKGDITGLEDPEIVPRLIEELGGADIGGNAMTR